MTDETQDLTDAKALFMQEHGELGAAVIEYFGDDLEDARNVIEDNYYGLYQSLADYAQDFIEQSYDIPDYLEGYIDYEKMARDMEMNGCIFTVETGYQEVHVFWLD